MIFWGPATWGSNPPADPRVPDPLYCETRQYVVWSAPTSGTLRLEQRSGMNIGLLRLYALCPAMSDTSLG
jgi:hypothetical protein